MRFNALMNLFHSKFETSPARRLQARRFKPTFDVLEDRRMLSGSTWWVGTAAGSNFADIQTAINSSSVHNGDTVKVEPGTYPDVGFPSDTVTVTKSLTIIGGQPKISTQNGPSIVTSDDVGFTLKVNDITIQHFTIGPATVFPATAGILTDAAHSGYKILDNIIKFEADGVHLNTALNKSAHDSTISGNYFFPGDTDGILSDIGARNVTISNNLFSNFPGDAAIRVAGSSLSTDVDIVANTVFGASILLENATDSEISGNTMSDPAGSTDPNLTAAIYLGGGVTETEVTHNAIIAGPATPSGTLVAIQVAPFAGTLLPANDDNDIAWNTVVGANLLNGGIILDGATSSEVSHNSVQQCLANGIELASGSTDNSVSHNTSNLNGNNGIEVNGSDGNSLSSNTTNNNAFNGILVDPSNNNNISGNTSNNNPVGISIQGTNNTVTCNTTNFDTNEGIFVFQSDKTTVSSNTASYSLPGGIGIFSFESTNTTISSNTANYNGTGIVVFGDSNAVGQKDKISDNTTNGNGDNSGAVGDGILVVDSTRVTISKNTANSNQLNGIEVSNTTEGDTFDTISGNTANYNVGFGGDGIKMVKVDSNTVTGNTASHNLEGNGIDLQNSDKNTLSGNTANFNFVDGIFVDIASTGNTIKNNTALNNGNWDIEDGTLVGTTNTWTGNTFNNKNPSTLS